MGLTRQGFLSHLIRSNFRQSLKEFVIGYTDSNPSIPLYLFYLIHILKNTDIRLKLSNLLSYISQELMQEDEQASYDEMENHISSPLAPRRKGIFVENGDSK